MYRIRLEIVLLIFFYILARPDLPAHMGFALSYELPELLGGGQDEVLGLWRGLDEEKPVPVAFCLGVSEVKIQPRQERNSQLTKAISVCSYIHNVGAISSNIIPFTRPGSSSAKRCATRAPLSCART